MAKYIRFEKIEMPLTGEKPEYRVRNIRHGLVLARIFWFVDWQQWCVEFEPNTVWSSGCLADVRAFVQRL